MRIEALSSGHGWKFIRRQFERLMQKAARTRCIDQKPNLQPDWLADSRAAEFDEIAHERRSVEFHPVQIFCSLADRLVDKEVINISTEPMCVSDIVARARGDKQFVAMSWVVLPGLVRFMVK